MENGERHRLAADAPCLLAPSGQSNPAARTPHDKDSPRSAQRKKADRRGFWGGKLGSPCLRGWSASRAMAVLACVGEKMTEGMGSWSLLGRTVLRGVSFHFMRFIRFTIRDSFQTPPGGNAMKRNPPRVRRPQAATHHPKIRDGQEKRPETGVGTQIDRILSI